MKIVRILLVLTFLVVAFQLIGCDDEEESSACSGEAAQCHEMLGNTQCESQAGCSWSTNTDSCDDSPGASECSDLANSQEECIDQTGCTWN